MKKIILLVAILPLLFSCSKFDGCTDDKATNFDIKAEKHDDSCVYTRLTFFADSTQYPSSTVDHIDIKIGKLDVGSFSRVYSIGDPESCGADGTASFSFEDAGEINWNARIFLVDGSILTKVGAASPDRDQPCILINTL